MALADYRLCDKCGCKVFYDANLDVSAVGALVVLCQECAKTHSLHIYARQGEAGSGFDGQSWVDLMGLSQRLRARAVDAEVEVANLQNKLETTSNGILYALRGQVEHQRRANQAEAALAERDTPCEWWRADDGFFETACKAPRYTSRAPKFCQNCGHPVKVVP